MWHTVENGEAVRPADVDSTSSRAYVYVRRNIQRIEATEDAPEHYRWEEMAIPKEAFAIYEQAKENEDALDDVYAALTELAEMIIEEI